MEEVVEIDMHRKVLVYANGDRFHQWQVLEHDPIAHCFGNPILSIRRHTCSRHVDTPACVFVGSPALTGRHWYQCTPSATAGIGVKHLIYLCIATDETGPDVSN